MLRVSLCWHGGRDVTVVSKAGTHANLDTKYSVYRCVFNRRVIYVCELVSMKRMKEERSSTDGIS